VPRTSSSTTDDTDTDTKGEAIALAKNVAKTTSQLAQAGREEVIGTGSLRS